MLLTITTTHEPATDLGYLLAKNPSRTQSFSLAYGKAHVFYPEASAERCTAALLLDIDPVGLTRRSGRDEAAVPLAPYVNDRPYVASSFLSVAIAQVFGSALNGSSRERPELVDESLPLSAALHVVPCRGGERFLRALFEPLGYQVEVARDALDERFPAWGDSRYFTVRLERRCRLRDLLAHLYVLVPVLDDEKHYWVGRDELEKLLRHGEGWLKDHPEREQIAHRYLRRQRHLTSEAMRRLVEEEAPDLEVAEEESAREEEELETKISLNRQRIDAVVSTLKGEGATRVIDLGCGEGQLLRALLSDKSFARVVGTDVSTRALEIAASRLRLDTMRPRQRERVELFQSSVTYRDARFAGYDAACAIEVIEHLDPSRLPSFERAVFEYASPGVVVVTTPNAEYNVKFESLPAGRFRHRDHRFEWTRAELQGWAARVAAERGYHVRFVPVGPIDDVVGAPTQMAVFTKHDHGETPARDEAEQTGGEA